MSLVFNNGALLFRNGQLAFAPACCCTGECCQRRLPIGPTPAHLPTVLHATITNVLCCAACDGVTFDLTWDAATLSWRYAGSAHACSLATAGVEWVLTCLGRATCPQNFSLSQSGSVCTTSEETNTNACSCSPLSLVFNFTSFSGITCCNDECDDPFTPVGVPHSVTITITE